ncbi:META domain-containing protein [Flavobacterium sp. JLP]|uniref:META domain-containing protein n=1 Tax=unclassified Flavobacterium TaxID=196869 RepID=UPI00188BA1FC|nr:MULTISPECIES: META domain-containing protein [unclassified Flavobacterium]MBF4493199.1 META domain-containing protein [Flavobacterium sp. MR2016-29]MBF4507463.1 META domain-containing protein [Flavobacterium sp. JLP]
MKRILMLFIAVSLTYSCKSSKEVNSTASTTEKSIEKKLQQTWVLENLNGKIVTEKDFSTLPKITMNASTFSGFTGCNAIKGNLLSKGEGQVQFTSLSLETKKCDAKKEGEFVQLLRTNSGYSVENNKLYLSNQFGLTMSFKKG